MRKEGKKYIIASAVLVVLALSLAACGGSGAKQKKEVRLSEYLKVSVSGFDGEGSITECSLDEEGLAEAAGGKEKIAEVLSKMDGGYTDTDLMSYYRLEYPKEENLSNDDVALIELLPSNPFASEEENAKFYELMGVEFVPAKVRISGLLVEIDSAELIGKACRDSLKTYCVKVFANSWMSDIKMGEVYFCKLKEGYSSAHENLILFSEDYNLWGATSRQYEGVVVKGWHSGESRYVFTVIEMLEYTAPGGELFTLYTPGYGMDAQIERLSEAYDIVKAVY